MIRFASLWAVALWVSTAFALPTLPTGLQVVPVHSVPPRIRLVWTEAGDAASYNIYRSDDGGTAAVIAVVPGGPAMAPALFNDSTVTAGHTYTYRLEASNSTGVVSLPVFTTSVNVVWPIAGGREILHGFNEPIGWAGISAQTGTPIGFHDGVDFNKTTTSPAAGDDVLAPRGGIVATYNVNPLLVGADNGNVGIRVDVGGGNFELDTFNHLATGAANLAPITIGMVVAPGQKLGRVGTLNPGFVGNFTHHVHYLISINGYWQNAYHGLLVFQSAADRDPQGKPPALFDENGDGKVALYRDHASGALVPYDPAKAAILTGDVDVEPEVTDQQGTNPRQAPISLGYWIEGPLPPTEQLDDVKSAIHPYRLYDFRNEYFGGAPAVACGLVSDNADAANAGCRGIVTCPMKPASAWPPAVGCNSVIKEGSTNFEWPVLHHFIVTHASGETGAKADVKVNQFWRTAATDDGGPVTAADANYAAKPTTGKPWQARFPDGDYTIHVVASDLEHPNVDLPLPVVRLENFPPFVKEITLAADADGNPATGAPGRPACEQVVYAYTHAPRERYPVPAALVTARAAAASKLLRVGVTLCLRVRFSEPMTSVSVALVKQRGAGPALGAFSGSLAKTHQTGDTFTGTLAPVVDQSGTSDADPVSDEKDLAIVVTGTDRVDGGGAMRMLDADGDGVPDPGGDRNHLVKAELSLPHKVLDVVKP